MTARKTVSILGATGSVGNSTLDLVRRDPARFEVVALTAGDDVDGLAEAARATGARFAAVANSERLPELRAALAGTETRSGAGEAAVLEAAQMDAEWTMAAIVGCAGLVPAMAVLERGGALAFANKEALVSAGPLMMAAARRSGAPLLPVDSEHNAVFQCLDRSAPKGVARIVLTASGGPFRCWPIADIASATVDQALKHPTWVMGAKISVDSATMMNKGLELIEARWLFDMPSDRLDILVHPQSVIHSMVEYVDGSVLAQLGTPDMRIPIAHCLAWPDRMETPAARLDLAAIGKLEFEPPDLERFPALRLAREALEAAGAAPAILNAANEVAVAAFLKRRILFGEIVSIVEATLARYRPPPPETIADVLAIDGETRRVAASLMEGIAA
jgi:1-deoxy-D-xylulose-5-phosphate reductoisomerase